MTLENSPFSSFSPLFQVQYGWAGYAADSRGFAPLFSLIPRSRGYPLST